MEELIDTTEVPSVDEFLITSHQVYDKLTFQTEDVLNFRGKSLSDWNREIEIPKINDDISISLLEDLNRGILPIAETIYSNYSYARGAYDLANTKYRVKINDAKMRIVSKAQENKTKVPAEKLLEVFAQDQARDEFLALGIAELFYEFWKSALSKIKTLDARLTSLSMLNNLERKYLQK